MIGVYPSGFEISTFFCGAFLIVFCACIFAREALVIVRMSLRISFAFAEESL